MGKKLDGRIVAQDIKANLIKRSQALSCDKVLTVYIGEDESSELYLKQQRKAADEIGIDIHVVHTPVLDYNKLNITTPFIIQQPMKLADGITKQSLSTWLNRYQKYDVDCACANNIAAISIGARPTFYPCTPVATIELLKSNKIQIAGKHIVVVGRSNTVGRPLAQMLENLNATVTMCHSNTSPLDLARVCSYANIIISAVGKPNVVSHLVIIPKPYQVYIDIGGNDIDRYIFDRCYAYCCSHGGVGAITTLKLMENILAHYERTT